MITVPQNPESLTKQQLQELVGSCVQDVQATTGRDYITAWRLAKTQYPTIFTALEKVSAQQPGAAPVDVMANMDPLSIIPPSPENLNRLGLHRSATPDEWNAAIKGAGGLEKPDYEKAFLKVSDLAARSLNISGKAADSSVATRHPNLKRLADTQKNQRQLNEGQPDANAGFQKINQPDTPFAKPLPGTGSFPNTTKAGLGAFKVGNVQEIDPQKFASNYNTPAMRKACVKSVASYLGWKNDIDPDEAEKTIPTEIPHMASVYAAYQSDCQQGDN